MRILAAVHPSARWQKPEFGALTVRTAHYEDFGVAFCAYSTGSDPTRSSKFISEMTQWFERTVEQRGEVFFDHALLLDLLELQRSRCFMEKNDRESQMNDLDQLVFIIAGEHTMLLEQGKMRLYSLRVQPELVLKGAQGWREGLVKQGDLFLIASKCTNHLYLENEPALLVDMSDTLSLKAVLRHLYEQPRFSEMHSLPGILIKVC